MQSCLPEWLAEGYVGVEGRAISMPGLTPEAIWVGGEEVVPSGKAMGGLASCGTQVQAEMGRARSAADGCWPCPCRYPSHEVQVNIRKVVERECFGGLKSSTAGSALDPS